MAGAIKNMYEDACMEYIKIFCMKHQLEFDFWVDYTGGTASFSQQYYFTIDVIRYDIDKNCHRDLIIQWQYDNMEQCTSKEDIFINFPSYVKGARY